MLEDHAEIWVIDDDPDVCQHLAMVFRRQGIEIALRSIPSAAAAHAALDDVTTPPRVVLIDHFLPDALGESIVGSAREALPSTSILLITAAPEELVLDGLDIEVLSKPIAIEALREHLHD